MESTIVNARISQAKKDAAAEALRSLGLTTSELINSAYDYLLENGCLPGTKSEIKRDQRAFSDFVEGSTFEIEWDAESGFDYKDLIRESRIADYESLA